MRRQQKRETDMTRCNGTRLLIRLLKHLRIGLGALGLMLLPASMHGSGDAGTILAEVAHAAEKASSDAVGTLDSLEAEFALSEPLYRGTDRGEAVLILSLVFSGLVAFSLWLFRHLHCVYATSRQGSDVASNCR